MRLNRNAWMVLSALVAFFSSRGQAMTDEEFFAGGLKAEKSTERSYVGARDEENLQVQASLPQPSRTVEGVGVALPTNDEDEPAESQQDQSTD